MQLSEFVKQRRKAVGLTQEAFADKAGVALTVVRKIEQGSSKIIGDNGKLSIYFRLAIYEKKCELSSDRRQEKSHPENLSIYSIISLAFD